MASEQDFAVGYYKGSCKLSICLHADIEEVWKNVVKGESVTLWCNGPKKTRNEDVLPLNQKKHKTLSALDEKNRRV